MVRAWLSPSRSARRSNDFKQYYIALREFVAEIPDGHVIMSGDARGVMQ